MSISSSDLELAIQPAYNIENDKIEYAEVLIRRLRDISGALRILKEVSSKNEEAEFDLAVLEKSLKYLSEIRPDYKIGVNIMGATLEYPDISSKIICLINQYNAKESLIIEINEETDFTSETVINNIKSLHNAGIKLALDDFGSSKANLNALILDNKNLFDIIKVDKIFIDDIDKGIKAKTDVLNILQLICRYTNTSSIVEGVETEKQLEIIKAIGFNTVQGFLFYKPSILYRLQ